MQSWFCFCFWTTCCCCHKHWIRYHKCCTNFACNKWAQGRLEARWSSFLASLFHTQSYLFQFFLFLFILFYLFLFLFMCPIYKDSCSIIHCFLPLAFYFILTTLKPDQTKNINNFTLFSKILSLILSPPFLSLWGFVCLLNDDDSKSLTCCSIVFTLYSLCFFFFFSPLTGRN